MLMYFIQSRSLRSKTNLHVPWVIFYIRPQKTQFISAPIHHTITDISKLGCPPLIDVNLPAISRKFACHIKSTNVCSLRTAYSSVQWPNSKLYTLILHYAKCATQPAHHWCFPDDGVNLTCILLQKVWDRLGLLLFELRPQNTGEDWNYFRPCAVKWLTLVQLWWHSGIIYRRMKYTNLVTRVVRCQCIVGGISTSRVTTLKCI